MGVFQKLGFGKQKRMPQPAAPVEVRVPEAARESDDDLLMEVEGEESLAPRPVRNKQELVAELQRNYAEVLELVRKFDQHLDARARREEELTRLVEAATKSASVLPELRDEQIKLREAMGELIAVTRDGVERNEAMGEAQREAIERAANLLEGTAEREGEVADALEGVRDSMGRFVGVNETLAKTLEECRASQEQRQDEFATALKKSQSLAVTAVAISAAMVVVAVVMALVVLMR